MIRYHLIHFMPVKSSSVLRSWAPHYAVDSSTHSFELCNSSCGLSFVSKENTVLLQGLLQDLETGDDVWVERDSACNSPTEAQLGDILFFQKGLKNKAPTLQKATAHIWGQTIASRILNSELCCAGFCPDALGGPRKRAIFCYCAHLPPEWESKLIKKGIFPSSLRQFPSFLITIGDSEARQRPLGVKGISNEMGSCVFDVFCLF